MFFKFSCTKYKVSLITYLTPTISHTQGWTASHIFCGASVKHLQLLLMVVRWKVIGNVKKDRIYFSHFLKSKTKTYVWQPPPILLFELHLNRKWGPTLLHKVRVWKAFKKYDWRRTKKVEEILHRSRNTLHSSNSVSGTFVTKIIDLKMSASWPYPILARLGGAVAPRCEL